MIASLIACTRQAEARISPYPEPYSGPLPNPECKSPGLVTLGDGFEGEALMTYDGPPSSALMMASDCLPNHR